MINNYNLTIAAVNFMTPEYMPVLVNSLHKQNAWWSDYVMIYDNGTEKTTVPGINDGFYSVHVPETLYSEFKTYPKVNDPGWRNYASAKHAKTLQYIIDNTHTKYLLLLDSDIIFTNDFWNVFSVFSQYEYVVGGYIRSPAGYNKRLSPWCSFLNLELLEKYDLKYYDPNRILYVNGNTKDDTGASIYSDCLTHEYGMLLLPSDNSFYIHFKGGSYTDKKKVNRWLETYRKYWE